MKHLKTFENEAAFEAAKDNLVEPWVVLVGDNALHYMGNEPQVTDLLITIQVDNTATLTPIFYTMDNVDKVLCEGSEITLSDYDDGGYGYQFDSVGDKVLTVVLKDNTYLERTMFYEDDWGGIHNLKSVEIPNSVTSIGDYAFQYCSSLTSIEIPNSVTSIGSDAFSYCSGLTSVTIGNSVTSIGSDAFGYCSSLTSIVVDGTNTVYDSRENCNAIIETATNTLIQGCNTTIIPNSVTSIGDYAFQYCSSLTSIEIPNSVTSIGIGAFYNCSGLTSVTYNGVTYTSRSALETALTNNGVTVGIIVFGNTALTD